VESRLIDGNNYFRHRLYISTIPNGVYEIQKMRILFHIHQTSVGGAEVMGLYLLAALKKRGHIVACASHTIEEIALKLREYDIPTFKLEGDVRDSNLRSIAKSFKADVLHGNTIGGGSYACGIATELGIIGGETIHGWGNDAFDVSNFEIVTSEKVRRMVRPKSFSIPIAVGMDRLEPKLDPQEFRKLWRIPIDVPLIGRVGRLWAGKGSFRFVKAFSLLPKEYYGVCAGWGREINQLINLSRELGCYERLRFTGGTLNPGEVLHNLDIVMYPTECETTCIATIDALLCGKPLVSSIIGCMDDHLNEEVCRIAYEPEDLAREVVDLVDHMEDAKEMGKRGKQRMIDLGYIDTELCARRHEQAYLNPR
jgi:glycosyltransferase involved in cell wall biosynthesis